MNFLANPIHEPKHCSTETTALVLSLVLGLKLKKNFFFKQGVWEGVLYCFLLRI